MNPEYWEMGERLQDEIRNSGYDHDTVDGIAVDIHDVLQATDAIRDILQSSQPLSERLAALAFELDHIRWHCDRGMTYLERAARG